MRNSKIRKIIRVTGYDKIVSSGEIISMSNENNNKSSIGAAVENYIPSKLWNKYYILLFISAFSLSLCSTTYNSILSLYIDGLSGSATMTGIALVTFTISAIIIRLFSGMILQRNNYFKVLITGIAILGIASLFFNPLPYIGMVIVIRFLQGGGSALGNSAQSVVICDVIPENRLSEGVSYFGLSLSLALAIGPMFGLSLISDGSFNKVFNACSAVLLISFLCVIFCYSKLRIFSAAKLEKRKIQTSNTAGDYHGIWKVIDKRSLVPAVINFTIAIVLGFVLNYLTLFANRNGLTTAGLFFTFQAITAFVSRATTGKAIAKTSPFIMAIPASLLGIIGMLFIMASANNGWLLIVAGAFIGTISGIGQTVYQVVAIRVAPEERRGVAVATFFLLLDIGIGVGGLMWGIIIDNFGFTFAIFGCIFFLALMLVLSAIFMRSPKYLC